MIRMRKMSLLIFSCFMMMLLLGSYSSIAQSQDTTSRNIFELEKTSLMAGIGLEYGFFGFKVKHKMHNHIKSIANLGLSPYSMFFNLGIEGNLDPNFSNYVAPYLSVMYGTYGEALLTTNQGIRETKLILGTTIGFGINVKFSKTTSSYLSFGANYRLAEHSTKPFIEDFNSKYDTGYTYIKFRRLLPTVGLAFRVWK